MGSYWCILFNEFISIEQNNLPIQSVAVRWHCMISNAPQPNGLQRTKKLRVRISWKKLTNPFAFSAMSILQLQSGPDLLNQGYITSLPYFCKLFDLHCADSLPLLPKLIQRLYLDLQFVKFLYFYSKRKFHLFLSKKM